MQGYICHKQYNTFDQFCTFGILQITFESYSNIRGQEITQSSQAWGSEIYKFLRLYPNKKNQTNLVDTIHRYNITGNYEDVTTAVIYF